MSDPFIGEVTMWGCNFAPYGWAFCDGQTMPIQNNQALFAVIGSQYGGNGQTTFALPNLVGKAPMHYGQGPGLTPRPIAQSDGDASIQLTANQLPVHSHTVTGVGQVGTSGTPSPTLFMGLEPASVDSIFFLLPGTTGTNTQLAPQALPVAGQGAAHENRQPFLGISFCIALNGEFPVRN